MDIIAWQRVQSYYGSLLSIFAKLIKGYCALQAGCRIIFCGPYFDHEVCIFPLCGIYTLCSLQPDSQPAKLDLHLPPGKMAWYSLSHDWLHRLWSISWAAWALLICTHHSEHANMHAAITEKGCSEDTSAAWAGFVSKTPSTQLHTELQGVWLLSMPTLN